MHTRTGCGQSWLAICRSPFTTRRYASSMSSTATSPAKSAAPCKVSPPESLAPDLAAEWALDPAIAFLNHGSFGARPKKVLEAQTRLRAEFEASPIEFLH